MSGPQPSYKHPVIRAAIAADAEFYRVLIQRMADAIWKRAVAERQRQAKEKL
jgi:hypothetical protein